MGTEGSVVMARGNGGAVVSRKGKGGGKWGHLQ